MVGEGRTTHIMASDVICDRGSGRIDCKMILVSNYLGPKKRYNPRFHLIFHVPLNFGSPSFG